MGDCQCLFEIQSPRILLRDVSKPVPADKRPPEDTMWRPPKSGDQETGDPAAHGGAGDPQCKRSSVRVRATAASKKARRAGAV